MVNQYAQAVSPGQQQPTINDYKAFGSFCPMYIEPSMDLLQNDRIAFLVLLALAWHADELGCCYPGPQRIASITKYAPGTVENALEKLLEMGLIRQHFTMLGARLMPFWQLSPYVIWIRSEQIQAALELWSRTYQDGPGGAAVIHTIRNVIQPESTSVENAESEPKTEPESEPTPPYKQRRTGATQTDEVRILHLSNGRNLTAPNGANLMREAQTNTPPSSAPPPPVDNAARRLAERVRDLPPGTRMAQAVELVATAGVDRVRAALSQVERGYRANTVRNPQGLLRVLLQPGMMSDEEVRSAADDYARREHEEAAWQSLIQK